MIINHNLPALNTYNKLTINNSTMSKSLEKLSSGLRINRAADDAAGLAISEKMRAQIRGLDQAGRNAQDGISLIQTAEGALTETHSILQRMRELSVQAANDTYTSQDRAEIQKEIDQLTSEIDRIANTTQFNTKNLLDGSTSALVSTDKLTTKVFMRDGLRVLDQFGQKAEGGGNYQLDITTTAGTNQVQKTDIFKIKHAVSSEGVEITNNNVTNYKSCLSLTNCTVCALATGSNLTLDFRFSDGVQYSLNIAGAGAVVTQQDVACAINQTAGLKDRITASAANACQLSMVANNANENFVFTATLTEGATCTLFCFAGLSAQINCTAAGAIDTTNASVGGTICVTNTCAASGITTATVTGATKTGTACLSVSCSATTGVFGAAIEGGSAANYTNSFACSVIGADGCAWNASLLLEVKSIDTTSCVVTLSIKAHLYKASTGEYQYFEGTEALNTGTACTFSLDMGGYHMCSICNVLSTANAGAVGCQIIINASAGGSVCSVESVCFNLGGCNGRIEFAYGKIENKASCFTVFAFGANGSAEDVAVKFTAGVITDRQSTSVMTLSAATSSSIGSIANLETKLYDIDKFWDASGNFILEDPQTITLVQGNGSKTTISLSGSDTIGDVVDKLNTAIADGLGQASLTGISSDTDKFASYVTSATEGLESVEGTFVIRSAVAGNAGEITFVGDDSVLSALGLTTIQKATNNVFTVDVTDAHSGSVVASDVKIADNNLVGVVQQNVDVQFDMSTGVNTTWDDTAKNWVLAGGDANKGVTFIHLADNTMVFHIGANQKQDIGMGIGDMSADALGVDNVQVTSNSLANTAIGKIDNAISRVSSERAKLGALQNRLEHTINNLSTTSENLTASESRIRDVDMAKEMMNFTKFQILSNAATSMLAQANQMPQSVLQLLR